MISNKPKIEDFKETFEKKVFLFVAKISDLKDNQKLPPFVNEEISRIANEKRINEKRASWGLLDYALKNFLKKSDDFEKIYKKDGKPYSRDYFFSFSHSHELVALAISKNNIGVDIEKVGKLKDFSRLLQYICTEDELNKNNLTSDDDLIKLWTKKESAFKLQGGKRFVPSQLETNLITSKTYKIEFNCEYYYITVCLDKDLEISFINLIC